MAQRSRQVVALVQRTVGIVGVGRLHRQFPLRQTQIGMIRDRQLSETVRFFRVTLPDQDAYPNGNIYFYQRLGRILKVNVRSVPKTSRLGRCQGAVTDYTASNHALIIMASSRQNGALTVQHEAGPLDSFRGPERDRWCSRGAPEEKAQLCWLASFQECDLGRVAKGRGFGTLAGSLVCHKVMVSPPPDDCGGRLRTQPDFGTFLRWSSAAPAVSLEVHWSTRS
jgi:hypothetical protein